MGSEVPGLRSLLTTNQKRKTGIEKQSFHKEFEIYNINSRLPEGLGTGPGKGLGLGLGKGLGLGLGRGPPKACKTEVKTWFQITNNRK